MRNGANCGAARNERAVDDVPRWTLGTARPPANYVPGTQRYRYAKTQDSNEETNTKTKTNEQAHGAVGHSV